MNIYDCFLFYNEFDLLELRLKELYDHVDHIVIIESDHTLTNHPKPYLFEQNRSRYGRWLEKIIHIKHKSSCHSDPWQNVYDQRNALARGIESSKDDDIIIFNDVDEIIRASAIDYIRNHNHAVIYGLHMPLFNFKFNFMRVDPGPYNVWTTAARADWTKKFGGQMVRNQLPNLNNLPFEYRWNQHDYVYWTVGNSHVIDHGGWHFGYLGNNDWLHDKARNTVHQEDNTKEFFQQLDVEKSIQEKKCWNRYWPYRYEIVDLDSYFPSLCKDYPQYCLPNSGISAQSLLAQHVSR
jgi:beta-1,4-mannosyl-glycoprotein beta-1,4-N-acetylglucosaminyltransferase